MVCRVTTPGSPERLGKYRLLEKLGQGGMALVYRGEQTGEAGFKKKVAIKRMLPQFRRDPSLLERFAAEARTNARLDHPNLVQVLDFGIEPEPYLVLEFVEGVSLGEIMQVLAKRKERFDVAAACFIGAEIASGLDHAHRKKDDDGTPLGIVHRDVSPQNVLISNEGAVKVSDFGLVKAADNVLKTASGVTIGKMSYMAPEQADGQEIDARADVFSLGVTVWEMLTIRSLIPPDDPGRAAQMLQAGNFPPPSKYNPEVPARLDEIVLNCLEVDPAKRTPSAQQVAQALRELLHENFAGYGDQQVARLIQWVFPERGWELPAPEHMPAQPSADERASIAQVTPATVALARASVPSDPPLHAGALQPPNTTGPHPAAITGGHRPSIAGALPAAPSPAAPPPPMASPVRGGLPFVALLAALGISVVALIALIAAALVVLRPTLFGGAPPAPPVTLPALPPPDATSPLGAPGVLFESSTPGLRLFLGPRELGAPPLRLTPADLTGEPLVALAPLHAPRVLRAEHLVELTRGVARVQRIELEGSHRPDIMVYIRYDGVGTAHLPSGRELGPIPGVVRVPTQRDSALPTEIVVFDDRAEHPITLSLSGCEPDKVCVLYTGAPPPTLPQ